MTGSAALIAVAAAILLMGVTVSSAVRAEQSCAALIKAGARVIDTYVMDFGPDDKLYVYILRTRSGATEKCTSQRPLRTQGR
ncbi:hypothetical protein [Chenggangzhangella methanolivorans]|uniref:Uncharacterized protein n=1 Tax=Chenggangzhangella methanolivorans TaxID=1437009 RepID=A0A9E6R4S3_9HYPH|nr:hypothetical protein [Chenggangzhangella methanolivorans]QZN98225.1 hypothetical protein K6K41_13755 [Chenggangzhangella methanolivorans]